MRRVSVPFSRRVISKVALSAPAAKRLPVDAVTGGGMSPNRMAPPGRNGVREPLIVMPGVSVIPRASLTDRSMCARSQCTVSIRVATEEMSGRSNEPAILRVAWKTGTS